ncbi:MAG: NUDIX domain-containing protein [Patescibacteria group bacterium]
MLSSHEEFYVELLNERGEVVGTKKRKDVDKRMDFLHGVYVLVFSKDKKLVLCRIPQAAKQKKLYAGRLGATAATIVRHREPLEVAARRVLATELFIDYADLAMLGEKMECYEDEVRRLVAVFYCTHKEPVMQNPQEQDELVELTRKEVEHLIKSDPAKFSLPFLSLWEAYQDRLPF